jgi:carbon monoxide dehydrogenase subunit G
MLEADDGTILSYQAETQIGGKLAQIGARPIDGVAKIDGQ